MRELAHAVARSSVAQVRLLVERLERLVPSASTRKYILNHSNPDGDTVLHLAAEDGQYQICRLLLEAGASPNAVNLTRPHSGTPLHQAAAKCHEACVELLVAHGGNPFLCNVAGPRPAAGWEGGPASSTSPGSNRRDSAAAIAQRLKRKALASCDIAVKVAGLGGGGPVWAVRHAVLLPRLACTATVPALELWLQASRDSVAPQTRLLLPGSRLVVHNLQEGQVPEAADAEESVEGEGSDPEVDPEHPTNTQPTTSLLAASSPGAQPASWGGSLEGSWVLPSPQPP
ncbi:ankyrin repeat domain-containing 27 [Haematococcus lacustris]|uniref:Ankyrin repeat domain-containing 27 n=1 Tax=Haematococcus lacustris TaxID=44745 RepID=A0A699YN89_HAELA|nr:ankyrin repeat domain-containing 27 [Haematococcus lacustris]